MNMLSRVSLYVAFVALLSVGTGCVERGQPVRPQTKTSPRRASQASAVGVQAPTPYRVWIDLSTNVAGAYLDTQPDPSPPSGYRLMARYKDYTLALGAAESHNQFYGWGGYTTLSK